MRTLHFRSLLAGALAVLLVAGNVAAQSTSALLNILEVQQLIARGEPADHARLATHFTALGERYSAEATRHKAMAQGLVVNSSRFAAANSPATHCKRLADLNIQSAATLRELAAHHKQLAAGVPSTPPRNSARFEGGEGAAEPTDEQLSTLAANANTPADHRTLEEYFSTLAKRYTAETSEHVAMKGTYVGTRIATAAAHCDRLIALSRDSAKEATAAAAMHNDLAGIGR